MHRTEALVVFIAAPARLAERKLDDRGGAPQALEAGPAHLVHGVPDQRHRALCEPLDLAAEGVLHERAEYVRRDAVVREIDERDSGHSASGNDCVS